MLKIEKEIEKKKSTSCLRLADLYSETTLLFFVVEFPNIPFSFKFLT